MSGRQNRNTRAESATTRTRLTGIATISSLLAITAITATAAAQPPTDEPLESPPATVSQVVGTKPITIAFHSPGVKGRKIWGELVPYGQSWRAGANDKTTFTFAEDVVIQDTVLAAGRYGFYILPVSDDEWQLVWNRSSVGSPNEFQQSEDVVRVKVKPDDAPFRERLLYTIENFTDWPPYSAELVLHWERKRVAVPVTVKARE